MNRFEQLAVRASTIDELLSDAFETLPGQKGDSDAAARRLAAWCRSCASGDWEMFARRLERDGLSFERVLARFATVRRAPGAPPPVWLADAAWIDEALRQTGADEAAAGDLPFGHLFVSLVEEADRRLWAGIDPDPGTLTVDARRSLRRTLLDELSRLCSGALFERFAVDRKYRPFVSTMRATGWQQLLAEKPVLLRLIATVVRQWIDTTRELILRLDADLPLLRREILRQDAQVGIARIDGGLSDPHNSGRSVQVVVFEDGSRIVYKPKDLRLDAAWQDLVERLNGAGAPVDLKAVRVLVRDGYGWTEFIDHVACADGAGFALFFRRAGAWLALFHSFASTDMHEENMIAAGDHPVPIDLEMILQASAPENESEFPERKAFDLASRRISESVMMTGLLPAYGRSPENVVYELGGLMGQRGPVRMRAWQDINTDTMRRSQVTQPGERLKNLPHCAGEDARLGDHIDDLVAGFEEHATFLRRQDWLFDGFAGLPVRKVVRPTRFYYLLQFRLKDHRAMDDGVAWSAQADFAARLADWDRVQDPLWPLQAAERAALVELNIPHFVSPADDDLISSSTGPSVRTGAVCGLERARARFARMDGEDIAWQSEVIRQSTGSVPRSTTTSKLPTARLVDAAGDVSFIAEAGAIFENIARLAIRSGPGAAWVGLDWLGDSDVSQLVPLGPDLYNGAPGVAVFLAAYARQTGDARARDLALAALAGVRRDLRSAGAARLTRALGIGGAAGLGSVLYALTLVSEFLGSDEVMADARAIATLFSDDLIAADKSLDVVGGSAGAILALLRLHRATQAERALERAMKCGDHLLGQPRIGSNGQRSWAAQGLEAKLLNGMSHGAAGYAYALSALAAASGAARFADAARECIAFENASYSAERGNWPDFRSTPGKTAISWPCQWCHGATGVGLARAATLRQGMLDAPGLRADVERALLGIEQNWPHRLDTLCCGTLGSIEFLNEAAGALGMDELRDRAGQRLAKVLASAAATGDYRFGFGSKRFNLGLFRGLSGVGYTLLRGLDRSLPNVLIWK